MARPSPLYTLAVFVCVWSSLYLCPSVGQPMVVSGHQTESPGKLYQDGDLIVVDTADLQLTTETLSSEFGDGTTTSVEQATHTIPDVDNATTAVPIDHTNTHTVLISTQRPILGDNSNTDLVFLWTENQQDYPSQHKALMGHVFLVIPDKTTLIQCAFECLKHPGCSSVNFYPTSRVCELSNSSHVNSPESLTPSPGCEYHVRSAFSVDKRALGPCAGDPCSGNGRCLETKSVSGDPTHLCLCHLGWAGPDCSLPEAGPRWGSWAPWGACSVTCHRGWRMRTRNCEDSTNGKPLSSGHCYGASQEYGICELQQCPRWETWGAWSECSTQTTCGSGVKVRQRACSNGGTVGVDRYCLGLTNESTPCHSVPCNGPMRLTGGSVPGEGRVEIYDDQHQQWSLVCADQMTTAMATMVCRQLGWPGGHAAVTDGRFGSGNGQFGLTSVSCKGSELTIATCKHNKWTSTGICTGGATLAAGVQCNVNGVWSLWTPWSQCSVTCASGIRTRTRQCNHPARQHGGRDCQGEITQTKPCTLDMCPVNGVWLPWGPWDACSVSCGNGTQTRRRDCYGPFYNGEECQGDVNQIQDCMDKHCPVDGVWENWSRWSQCSQTCAGGTQTRDRHCTGPFYNGQPCDGASREEESCNTQPCPVDGVWLNWLEWAPCSATCGGGTRERARACQPAMYGGKSCRGQGQQIEDCNLHLCPIDGVWRDWVPWSECSVSCGHGTQTRTRTCHGPYHLGKDCEGERHDTQACMSQICPVNGTWLPWSDWTECSKTCSTGTQERVRVCNGPFYGGDNCTGPDQEARNCNTQKCPVDGRWEPWSDWSVCSVTCGGGNQSRTRQCLGPWYGGSPCDGLHTISRMCNKEKCPVDGYFNNWSRWTGCDVTCGGGLRQRNRTCEGPYFGGKQCDEPYTETGACNVHPCPIDGVFMAWSDWSSCSVTCGGGVANRSRECEGPHYGGQDCEGATVEETSCNENSCPEDGAWLNWSRWSECSETCGGGEQARNRSCVGTSYGGDYCQGDHHQVRQCNNQHCPIDGVWSAWSVWNECSVTCGGGFQARNRSCDGPYYNGLNCLGDSEQNQTCNTQPCPIDGYYNAWSVWSPCSVTCGGGSQSRDRMCNPPQHGGQGCQGDYHETKDCNIKPCPVDGVYLAWSAWSECSVTCGGGHQWRNRTCQAPLHGGEDCTGPDNVTLTCNTQPCPVDGVWLDWTEWSVCTVTCGGGLSTRSRQCELPQHGGQPCLGSPEEKRTCAENLCPIPGEWFPWSEWTLCPVTCGGGMKTRERECDTESYGNLTAPCEGLSTDTQPCHDFPCLPLAATCSELAERGLRDSNIVEIDVDGSGVFTLEPVMVYCDMETDGGVGVTVVGHDQEDKMMVQGLEAADGVQLHYNISFDHVLELVDRSASCRQYISWECFAALIHNKLGQAITGWLTREQDIADYFGGATPGSHSCACGINNTCVVEDLKCNCDANDEVWRQDEGFLTYKDDLPVYAFMAGDTDGKNENGYKQIGPLLCHGKEKRTFNNGW